LNVKLAELLSRSGILSVPESIIRVGKTRRLPDVLVGNFLGMRVVLEGKIFDKKNAVKILENDCKKRIQEGIAGLAIGILYPPELRNVDWSEIERELMEKTLRIRIFSESDEGNWTNSDIDGISAMLRRTYDSLITEDVVNNSVDELRESIEEAAQQLSISPGTAGRLKEILILPHQKEGEGIEE
jgi:hypothetical protein